MRLAYLSREEFVNSHFDYLPGQHVQVISPTGGGKTELLGQLAEVTLPRYPDFHYVSFMPKTKDLTARKWMDRLDLTETETWPPRRKRNGNHILWPKHIKNDDAADEAHLRDHFGRAIDDLFWGGESIAFADDAYYMAADLGLGKKLDRHWTMGRSMKSSLWTSLQKPSGTVRGGVSSYAYDQPSHMFFGRDSNRDNLKRISELAISTIDPRDIQDIVRNLNVHRFGESAVSEMLYVDRSGPYMCIVGV